ncbi:MAG: RNA polymerase sigma factor [Verrucomicrobiales bacterium]
MKDHSFEQFMLKYQDMVFTTAIRLLASEAEAKDIAQEVFLKAYERFGELENSPTVGGWLKTVATNLSLNHLTRYRARWRFFSEFFSGEDESDETPFDIPFEEVTHLQMDEADQRQLLEAALLKLPPTQRVPLALYHFEGQSYEEISARLKISLSKVKTDIFRAREALRKKLANSEAAERYSPNRKADGKTPGDIRRVQVPVPTFNLLQQIYG